MTKKSGEGDYIHIVVLNFECSGIYGIGINRTSLTKLGLSGPDWGQWGDGQAVINHY